MDCKILQDLVKGVIAVHHIPAVATAHGAGALVVSPDKPGNWTFLQDPVDGSSAVLVKRYNITQQKELELKLAEHQEALQR